MNRIWLFERIRATSFKQKALVYSGEKKWTKRGKGLVFSSLIPRLSVIGGDGICGKAQSMCTTTPQEEMGYMAPSTVLYN